MNSIRELIFGLEDGLVSTMGAIAGIAAGTDNASIVILSGLVIIAVEALSMTAGSYLSNKSHRQMLEKRIEDERRKIESDPRSETADLRGMYLQRGFSEAETEILVRRITADKALWLEEMTSKELKIGTGDLEEPKSRALVMGIAYVIGGGIPLLPYLIVSVRPAIVVSVAATTLTLFLVGYLKGRAAGVNRWKSAWEMVLVASSAALIAYAIGKAAGHFYGLTT